MRRRCVNVAPKKLFIAIRCLDEAFFSRDRHFCRVCLVECRCCFRPPAEHSSNGSILGRRQHGARQNNIAPLDPRSTGTSVPRRLQPTANGPPIGSPSFSRFQACFPSQHELLTAPPSQLFGSLLDLPRFDWSQPALMLQSLPHASDWPRCGVELSRWPPRPPLGASKAQGCLMGFLPYRCDRR